VNNYSKTKDLVKDLSHGDYGYEQVASTLKREKFQDYLRSLDQDIVEELTVEALDRIFQTTTDRFYILTELLTYFGQMNSPEVNAIEANPSLKEIMEELVEHMIRSRLHLMQRVYGCSLA
jgi:SPX domain protein involved in polyphosphate accumulation